MYTQCAPGTSVCLSLGHAAQVGFLIDEIGEFGKAADLRRDAKALAAKLQDIVSKYDGAEFRGLQQRGMRRDAGWELPAREWEQVKAIISSICTHYFCKSCSCECPL